MLKKFVIIIIVVSALAGCTKVPKDGFSPVDQLTTETNPPKTLSDLETFLIPGYSNFRKSFNLYGFDLLPVHFASLEHSAILDLDGSEDKYWVELITGNTSITNPYVGRLWEGLYTGVKNANVFLEVADNYEANYAKPTELQSIDEYRGEAYFLRAWYYFQLECFFGESYMDASGAGGDKMGVPIFTKISSDFAHTHLPRSTVKQVWDQIIADLKLSAEKLQTAQRVPGSATEGRASVWAAKSLLGKAYVYTQDWANAKLILKDVIDNSNKTLLSFNTYKDSYNGNPVNEFNNESIFEINVERRSSGNGIFTSGTNPDDLTTSMSLLWGPAILGKDGTEYGGGNVDLGRVNISVQDKNLRRFGFKLNPFGLVINPDFSGDTTKPAEGTRAVPIRIMDPEYRQQSIDLRNNKNVDPRLYVCAMQPWVDSAGNKEGTAKVPVAKAGAHHAQDFNNTMGWSFKKYTTFDKAIYNYNSCDGANIYLIRLADVYLLYAEACANSGEGQTALEYVNKVHRRAYGQLDINAPSVFDYQGLDKATKADPTDVDLAMNPLRYERYAELFAEGSWWFDVCRWKLGSNEASYYSKALTDGTTVIWNDKSYAYPIPNSEMVTNPQMTGHQNPGYGF